MDYGCRETKMEVKAIEKYNDTSGLVLMGYHTGEMDGIQALKKIKEADVKCMYLIMCSAMGQQAMVIEAISLVQSLL